MPVGRRRVLPALVALGAVLWLAALVAAPWWRARHDAGSGVVGGVLVPLLYAATARVCHQRPERSFAVAGETMPVCGRCAALYFTGAIGLIAALAGARRPAVVPGALDPTTARAPEGSVGPWTIGARAQRGLARAGIHERAVWLAIAASPTILTWILEHGLGQDPGTVGRALAAVPLGMAAGWMVGDRLRRQ